jgi:type I site-specific restriction-modification system R (restriction) subunit
MITEPDFALRIIKLENMLELYKPILKELQGVLGVVEDMEKIQKDLRSLRESRIETKEKLINLLKEQDKIYKDTTGALQDKEIIVKKEVAKSFESFENRLSKTELVIDSFKIRGWDVLSRLLPWLITAGAALYALFKT